MLPRTSAVACCAAARVAAFRASGTAADVATRSAPIAAAPSAALTAEDVAVTHASSASEPPSSRSHSQPRHRRRGTAALAVRVVAAAAVVAVAPVGWYYQRVYVPRTRQLRDLLQQSRPERTTRVFATGAEPVESVRALLPPDASVVAFYARSLARLVLFAFRCSGVVWLLAQYACRHLTRRIGLAPAAAAGASIPVGAAAAGSNAAANTISLSASALDAAPPDPLLQRVGAELARVFDSMGGAYVKLGQWCATRSDVFPREVCEALEVLYDKAAPHAWADTERMLRDSGLLAAFESVERDPVSSGTIAQVYRARLRVDAAERDRDLVRVRSPSSAIAMAERRVAEAAAAAITSAVVGGGGGGDPTSSMAGAAVSVAAAPATGIAPSSSPLSPGSVEVAVKVMHPRIRMVILEDMQALMWAAGAVAAAIPGASYLGLTQAVQEFTALLYSQLDMVREAENLNDFRFYFRASDSCVFPRPFLSLTTADVLVETFEYGVSLNSRCVSEITQSGGGGNGEERSSSSSSSSAVGAATPPVPSVNSSSSSSSSSSTTQQQLVASPPPLRASDYADLGKKAVDMFLSMVFEHNFIHADLHPGNILVRIVNSDGTYSMQRTGPRSHSQLVVLDPGLVTSMSEKERANFIALFTCVATGDGDLGARLMLERSPEQHCDDVPSFTRDMKGIFDRVTPKTLRFEDVDLAGIMREILDTMRQHHVRIDMNFASLVATVALGEGLGRRLVRDFNLFEAAMPFLLLCLRSHELHYMVGKLQEMYLTDSVAR
jgi:predicted unusual protein kinase regulating ubiquinone biosynthesis (AarF/ABC1/UbiB family)